LNGWQPHGGIVAEPISARALKKEQGMPIQHHYGHLMFFFFLFQKRYRQVFVIQGIDWVSAAIALPMMLQCWPDSYLSTCPLPVKKGLMLAVMVAPA